jgi:hypothetical protein
MNPAAGRGKWAKPWLNGSWVVILLTTLTVPAWAESLADQPIGTAITQNRRLTLTEPGEANVLNELYFDTPVASGEPLLRSPESPKSRLQPYLTVEPEDSAKFFPREQSYTDNSVRLNVGAGVTWHLLSNIEIFGEYRPEFQLRDGPEPVTLESDVGTHQIIGGISFRY